MLEGADGRRGGCTSQLYSLQPALTPRTSPNRRGIGRSRAEYTLVRWHEFATGCTRNLCPPPRPPPVPRVFPPPPAAPPPPGGLPRLHPRSPPVVPVPSISLCWRPKRGACRSGAVPVGCGPGYASVRDSARSVVQRAEALPTALRRHLRYPDVPPDGVERGLEDPGPDPAAACWCGICIEVKYFDELAGADPALKIFSCARQAVGTERDTALCGLWRLRLPPSLACPSTGLLPHTRDPGVGYDPVPASDLRLSTTAKTDPLAAGVSIQAPSTRALAGAHLAVHSEIVLVDDVFACAGSANFHSRSMAGVGVELVATVTMGPGVDDGPGRSRPLRRIVAEYLRTPLADPRAHAAIADLDLALGASSGVAASAHARRHLACARLSAPRQIRSRRDTTGRCWPRRWPHGRRRGPGPRRARCRPTDG